ncbi:MAG: membrane protein insertase YidC [Fulvivirga sp.]|uniref:membrane protein insertase YidC n=1 Tax=Fulvivirga sp. TaxID=1931237 RepID=UPI0032EEAB7D
MDKNQATGLILIALMLITYFTFFKPEVPPQEEPIAQTEEVEKSLDMPDSAAISPAPTLPDSLLDEENRTKYGVFAPGANGESTLAVLENELVKLSIDTKGAKITEVLLKNFKSKDDQPVRLITEKTNEFSTLITSMSKSIDLNELYYSSSSSNSSDGQTITFSLNLGNGKSVSHQYFLAHDTYEVDYNLKLTGLDGDVTKDEILFNWNEQMITQEKDVEMSRINSTVNYYTLSDGFDELSERSTEYEEEIVNESIKWSTIKQRFFLSAILAEKSFSKGKFSTDVDLNNPEMVKNAKVSLSIPKEDITTSEGGNFTYYFGPNDYHITTEFSEGFSKNLWLGYPPMLWVNKYVIIPLFDLLNNVLDNYGLIIILIVLVIKLVLSPLSYKSYLSMAKMKVLKPELDEIKEKHGDDMSKAQQEQMKLYQQVGVNPISGCVPMLLQMPILLAMFYFFPQSIELRGEGFLWADDLSNYDSIMSLPFEIPFYGDHVSLFVLLMTASTILITYSQQQVSSVQGPMKSLSYMMPVIFMFVLNSYPAALSFYYFVSNIVTFGQQVLIRKFVDEDKIRTILDENKKNAGNRKKSKFQQRLEDAMKAQAKKKGKK